MCVEHVPLPSWDNMQPRGLFASSFETDALRSLLMRGASSSSPSSILAGWGWVLSTLLRIYSRALIPLLEMQKGIPHIDHRCIDYLHQSPSVLKAKQCRCSMHFSQKSAPSGVLTPPSER